MVTEPCIQNSNEAYLYVNEVRKLVQWIGVSNGNMEEGSLRCDANISIRPKGENKLGTKVEVKNLNSVRNIKKAIDFEIERMIELKKNGIEIVQQTRSFDATTDTTFALREKENTNDYRYFADPDLAPFIITESKIEELKNTLPVLPLQLKEELINKYNLSSYDAEQLTANKATADFFIQVAKECNNYKAIANWLNGPIKQHLNNEGADFNSLSLSTKNLANLIALTNENKVSFAIAASKILPILLKENKNPLQIAVELNLLQTSNTNELENWVNTILSNMPDKVEEYKKGKKGLIGLFVGEVKKISKGKADPKMVTEILQQKLK